MIQKNILFLINNEQPVIELLLNALDWELKASVFLNPRVLEQISPPHVLHSLIENPQDWGLESVFLDWAEPQLQQLLLQKKTVVYCL